MKGNTVFMKLKERLEKNKYIYLYRRENKKAKRRN